MLCFKRFVRYCLIKQTKKKKKAKTNTFIAASDNVPTEFLS